MRKPDEPKLNRRCWLAAAISATAGLACGPLVAAQQPLVDVQSATMRAPREGFDATVIALTVVARDGVRIVGASLPGARSVQLMAMQRDGEVVQMRPASSIDLPAGQRLELRTGEGGRYLMALHQRPAPAPGRVLRLRLDLADASGKVTRQQVPVRVLPARSGGHGGANDVH